MNWTVYILRCHDGSYYIGHTNDPQSHITRHLAGYGACHTKSNPPEACLYQERFDTEKKAVTREHQLKKWSRAKKEALISGDLDGLRKLSQSRE